MKIFTLILCLSLSALTFAQTSKLPVIRANAALLSVKEETGVYRDAWIVDPNLEEDVYVPQAFSGEMELFFFSDIDTLLLRVQPNQQYSFIVQLSDGQKAFTTVNTNIGASPSFIKKLDYQNRLTPDALTDTLPFVLGSDNRIYVQGKVNGSEELKFMFDTGANAVVLTTSAIRDKVRVKLDGRIDNEGGDGRSVVERSNNNDLLIGDLLWEGVDLISIDYGEASFDGVLGWVVFENKMIEIDYDHNYMVIHKALKEIPAGYLKQETTILRSVPYINCALTIDEHRSDGWVLFDTGYDGTLFLSQQFASSHDLNGRMEVQGTSYSSGSTGISWKRNDYIAPQISLGALEMENIPIAIAEQDPPGIEYNDIMGNDLLKNFNAIIDLKNFTIYLKPNHLTGSSN